MEIKIEVINNMKSIYFNFNFTYMITYKID